MHGRVGGSANLESMDVELVSGNYFSVLGVKPILGHGFTEAEDEPAGGHPVAMVSYSWWKRRLGRDPAIVGKAVTLESTVYTIIGVTPPEFFGATVGRSSATTRSAFAGKRAFAWAPSFDKNRQTGGDALQVSFEAWSTTGRRRSISCLMFSNEPSTAGAGSVIGMLPTDRSV